MIRRLVVLGVLAAISASAFAQEAPPWLGQIGGRIFRGAAVRNLQQAVVDGQIEVQAEIPVSENDLLAARLRVARIENRARWSVLVTKDSKLVSMFPLQEVTPLPGGRPYDRLRLRAIVPVQYSAADYRFYFMVAGRDLREDLDTRIVFGDASLIATRTPRTLTSISVQPAYTNVEGSDKQWVLEVPVRISFPRPFGGGGANPIHASFSATPSTQIKDVNAGFTAAVGQEMTSVYRGNTMLPYLRREWGVRYRSNAELTNRKVGAFYSFEVPLTSRPIDSGIGYRTQAPAMLKLGLLSVEYRTRVDQGVNPHHTATFLANPWAQITLPPLYFGGGDNPSPFRHVNLVVSARGWAFPFEEARGGYGVHRFESRFDAELTVPLGATFGQAFILGFHTGANENNNYLRQSTVTLEFRLFGRRTSLYRTPE